ncbi:hypothetical protein AERO9A_190183 [Aeromonas salmonicida]|nr:hypothetical protein AERO9A_190183 [Aeromonas salmonicida]
MEGYLVITPCHPVPHPSAEKEEREPVYYVGSSFLVTFIFFEHLGQFISLTSVGGYV